MATRHRRRYQRLHPEAGPQRLAEGRVAEPEGQRLPITCAVPVLDFIHRIHREGVAEIRWHTTWQKDSALIEQAFGLPHLPVQDCPEFDTRYASDRWFKLPAAERVVMKDGRDLIWTDDDLGYCKGGDDWVTLEYMREERRILTIAPSDNTGLTPKHLRSIDEFLGSAS